MKKLLALVLALVMSMSLVTISNAAFKDADSIDYKEAVDVMNAVGVFVGDEKGNFNAKENLTREQAAKIIAYLELGSKAADAMVGGNTFTDVASSRWSAGFIAYCAQAGIVSGVGDGKFAPAGQLMPAAEDAVYGHKAGESFRFDFTYPAEFRVPELSGKTAQFAITLHTVEQKQPVPLDDAFAKTLGFDTVDALKESIREKKRRSHEANADRIAGAALLGMAGANLTAELDNAILDQNADHDMNALRERLRRSKMTMELYCKAGQTTPDEVRAAFRRDAERKMRSILAVQAIAKAEQITVSNAEVDAEYVRLSKLHDTPEAEIRNVLSRDAVASAVTTQKVQRFLIDHANITSVVEKE